MYDYIHGIYDIICLPPCQKAHLSTQPKHTSPRVSANNHKSLKKAGFHAGHEVPATSDLQNQIYH